MRVLHRNSQVAVAAVVLYSVLLIAALGFSFRNQFPRYWTEPARPAAMNETELRRLHTGTILIPEGILGRCRRLTFDNSSGVFRQGRTGPCHDEDPLNSPAEVRVNAIRDSFVKR